MSMIDYNTNKLQAMTDETGWATRHIIPHVTDVVVHTSRFYLSVIDQLTARISVDVDTPRTLAI